MILTRVLIYDTINSDLKTEKLFSKKENLVKKITYYERIVTHAGVFHADEVLAIVYLLILGFRGKIERKYKVSDADLNDPRTLVLDTGKRYDPKLGNFDHHQDKILPATCMLVLKHFTPRGKKCVNAKLARMIFQHVSDVDNGIIPDGGHSAGFNAIIRNLRRFGCDAGFGQALVLARITLEGYVLTAEAAVLGDEKWVTLEKGRKGKFRIQDDTFDMPDWPILAREEGVYLLVRPYRKTPNGYQIITRSKDDLVIPEAETQTYRHHSGFMAAYASREAAIQHAEEITANL